MEQVDTETRREPPTNQTKTWQLQRRYPWRSCETSHEQRDLQLSIRQRLRQEGELRTQQAQEAAAAKRRAAADKRLADKEAKRLAQLEREARERAEAPRCRIRVGRATEHVETDIGQKLLSAR